ncbi:MAG: hypothetical protein WD965_03120 [Actinomycetota bacterium]
MSDRSTFVLPPPPDSAAPAPASHRSRLAALLAGALAVALVATGVFLFRGGGRAEAVPLALAFAEGESENYTISQSIEGDLSLSGFGGEIPEGFAGMHLMLDMSETVTWDVLSVDADGVATISVTTSDASASINGFEAPSSELAGPPVEMRVAPDGRILSIEDVSFADVESGGLPGQGSLPGMNQVTPLLPEDGAPVAPGDTWDASYSQDFPFAEGSIDYDVHSTYLRNEEIGGVDAAVIRSTMTVPIDLSFRMKDLAAFIEEQEGVSEKDLSELRHATMAFEGTLEFDMTSFVDFEAQKLLRSESAGTFDFTMEFAGFPDFEGALSVDDGTFTQEMTIP